MITDTYIPRTGILFGEANANFAKFHSKYDSFNTHRKEEDINAD